MTKSWTRYLANASLFSSAAIASALFLATPAAAELVELEISLDQAQEVPAPQAVDGAGGLGVVIADTDTNTISWTIVVENLSGDVGGVHFHGPAEAGQPGDVALNIGEVSGLGTNLVGTAELSPEQMEQVLGGLWYVNFHTALNRPGEVRGQVVAP